MAEVGLRDVLDEMANAVRGVLSSADAPVQVETGMVLFPTPPVVDVFRLGRSPTDAAAFGDIGGALRVRIRVRVPTADHDAGAGLLISFCDASDELYLLGALEADPTLNGKVTKLSMTAESDDTAYETPEGAAHLGCHWDFLVTPARS